MLRFRLLLIPLMFFLSTSAQDLVDFNYTAGAAIKSIVLNDENIFVLRDPEPSFSFLLNGQYKLSTESLNQTYPGKWTFELDGGLKGKFSKTEFTGKRLTYVLFLENTGYDTLILENVVPFGQKDNHVHITSTGSWELARAKLFRPGYGPVRVLLPDNAWEMGYGSFRVENNISLCAISRRTAYEGSVRRRYQTLIPPGGITALRSLSLKAKERQTRFFIAYNPWDESIRKEDSYKALTRIISAIEADGVVLDTRGKSSYELQQAADRARPGVVMYSEGMAIPEDMPGIVSGIVHDAIRFQPELNMNKLIKPEFGIFRVCHIRDGRLHREAAISFLNGIGTEIIGFAPGRPAWMDEEFIYLGKTTMILREHKKAFLDRDWIPLIETLQDSVWVNQWQDGEKYIYTVYSLLPEGSYYTPTSSIWYVKGGPQPIDQTQMLLLVSPGFDRCSTVGFRCVKDAY